MKLRFFRGLQQSIRQPPPPLGALRFHVSPCTVPEGVLIKHVEKEGKPIFMAVPWNSEVTRKRALNSRLISYSTDNVNALGEEKDYEGIRKRLESMNLGGVEVVLKFLTDGVAHLDARVKFLECLNSTESSARILVYECMQLLAGRLSGQYKVLYQKMSETDYNLWEQVLDKFIRIRKLDSNVRNVMSSKLSFETGMATLYSCLKAPKVFGITKDEYRFLREVMIPFYRSMIANYCDELGDEGDDEKMKMVKQLLAPGKPAELELVLKEWSLLEEAQLKRNEGGHVASYLDRNGPERQRLERVRKVLAMLIDSNNEYVRQFKRTSKAALLELEKSIEKERPAPAVSNSFGDASDSFGDASPPSPEMEENIRTLFFQQEHE